MCLDWYRYNGKARLEQKNHLKQFFIFRNSLQIFFQKSISFWKNTPKYHASVIRFSGIPHNCDVRSLIGRLSLEYHLALKQRITSRSKHFRFRGVLIHHPPSRRPTVLCDGDYSKAEEIRTSTPIGPNLNWLVIIVKTKQNKKRKK